MSEEMVIKHLLEEIKSLEDMACEINLKPDNGLYIGIAIGRIASLRDLLEKYGEMKCIQDQ